MCPASTIFPCQQLTVICALCSGANQTGTAQEAGVHRNIIGYWWRNSLPFQLALAHAQYNRALCFREKMEGPIDLAVQALHGPIDQQSRVRVTLLEHCLRGDLSEMATYTAKWIPEC